MGWNGGGRKVSTGFVGEKKGGGSAYQDVLVALC